MNSPGGSSGGRPSRCQSGSERPVASTTSSARAIRVRSRGFRRSAETGSRRASSACSASTPSRSSRARTASRTSAGIGGTAERPRVSALKYRPEPPMKIGRRSCRARLRQHFCGIRHPGAGREIDGRVDMAIEPVRRARLLLQRRPRRDDAEIAIDLHGIGVDDDAAGLLRQFERQRRLAAGGRPCDKHGLAQHPSEFACMSLVATLICNPGQSRARHHHRRRRAGRSALARHGAMAVRRGGGRHSLRLSGQEPGRHQGDRSPPASGARRPADRHCRAACRRHGARSFFWRTWIPP